MRFAPVTLKPQETVTYLVLAGVSGEKQNIEKMTSAYRTKKQIEKAFEAVKKHWTDKVNVDFSTGDTNIDNYLKWICFQPVLRRIYGCSFLPYHDYGKGGRGWRDLWQDCLALLIMEPSVVRQMIVDNYGGVRMDGTNATIIGSRQGEFIADRNNITRVWMDHAFWPFVTTKLYLDQTGDLDILLDNGMYAVVNLHWDNGWIAGFSTDYDTCMEKYTRIWEQVTERFADYGDHLILESMNEEGCFDDLWNRYSGSDDGKAEAYGIVNRINQQFVDLVRDSRGNNPRRHLLIAGYATDVDLTCDEAFQMPQDEAGRCAVSVHYYTPPTFCILEEDADWGKAKTMWGSPRDQRILENDMDKLKSRFLDNGVPVIIGEYGCFTKNKTEETVRTFLTAVAQAAYTKGMCPMLWDVTGVFYDRNNCRMLDSQLEQDLQEIAAAPRDGVHNVSGN